MTLDNVFFAAGDPGTNPGTQIVGPSDPVVLNADLDPGTGNFTVEPGDVTWPPAHSETQFPGHDLDLSLEILENLTGNIQLAGDNVGRMTTDETDFQVNVVLTPQEGGGDPIVCAITPIPLELSTDDVNPFFLGERFAGPGATNGAIVDDWATLPPWSGPPACALLGSFSKNNGPGALWLSNGISSPEIPRDCEQEGEDAYQASLDSSQAGIDNAEARVAKAETQLAKSQQQLKKAKKGLKKAKKSGKKGKIKKAKKKVKKAKAAVAQKRKNLQAANKNLQNVQNKAEADAEQARANAIAQCEAETS